MAVVRLTKRLWVEYLHQVKLKAARQAAENLVRLKRQQLIVDHMHTARAIARQVFHRFRHAASSGNSKISFEDFVSAAYVGLVESAGRWEPAKGDFAKYCYFRVRGAIIDAHRRQAYQELLPVSLEDLRTQHRLNTELDEGNEFSVRDPSPLPDQLAGDRQARTMLTAVTDRILPDDERKVIRAALAGRNVTQIARESRQSQIWARGKLNAAKAKLAAEVQRRVA